MEKYCIYAGIYMIIVVMYVPNVSSDTRQREDYYRLSKNGELLNPNPCQLYKVIQTYTYNLDCLLECTSVIGCSNVHYFNESDLCLLCIDENANVTDEWQGLTPYNTPRPQGGQLYEKINADECEYGKGCYNGGTCVDGVFSYTCLCPPLFTGSTCEEVVPSSCADLGDSKPSGVYNVSVQDSQNKHMMVPVYCDMDTDGGGWTVFQRRKDGLVSFAQNWTEYKEGFGDLMGDFWLGNDLLALMTAPPANVTLRVELEAFDGGKGFAKYATFRISDESDKYRLYLASYSGTAGDGGFDGLLKHSGMKFTTMDNDNDRSPDNCSPNRGGGGGFWFMNCESANLNGLYRQSAISDVHSIHWRAFRSWKALKHAEMKLKQV